MLPITSDKNKTLAIFLRVMEVNVVLYVAVTPYCSASVSFACILRAITTAIIFHDFVSVVLRRV